MKIARLASLFVIAGSLLAQAACTAKTETSATCSEAVIGLAGMTALAPKP